MIKLCVFDIDGTLLNSIKSLSYAMTENMKIYGYKEIDIEHTKLFVGDGYEKFVERSLIYCGDTKLEHYNEACKSYRKIFDANCLKDVVPYEGMVETLGNLKKLGIMLEVLSNKPQPGAEENIANFFEKDLFYRVYGERTGIPRKPDPTLLNLMLKELNIKKDECMYFGDTNTDMQTGKSAGVVTVGVTWGFRDRTELESFNPNHIIDKPTEIIDLLKYHD